MRANTRWLHDNALFQHYVRSIDYLSDPREDACRARVAALWASSLPPLQLLVTTLGQLNCPPLTEHALGQRGPLLGQRHVIATIPVGFPTTRPTTFRYEQPIGTACGPGSLRRMSFKPIAGYGETMLRHQPNLASTTFPQRVSNGSAATPASSEDRKVQPGLAIRAQGCPSEPTRYRRSKVPFLTSARNSRHSV